MYVKYNHVLRVIGRVHLRETKVNVSDFVSELQKPDQKVKTNGNTYTTTLHVINSAVVKLSRLTIANKVPCIYHAHTMHIPCIYHAH